MYLPEYINYYGFDLSHEYIDNAKKKYGDRGSFFCASVTDPVDFLDIQFDICIIMGVLHHLSDEEVQSLFTAVLPKLKNSGRLITLDPCFSGQQNMISRFLITHDRGRNVRTPEQYSKLAEEFFEVHGVHTNFNEFRTTIG